MQKLVQENKVCAILGGSLFSNALAEEATAAELKVPMVIDNAAATEITGKNCNRYTFRLNTPVLVQSRMLAPYALKNGKKWYFITALRIRAGYSAVQPRAVEGGRRHRSGRRRGAPEHRPTTVRSF